MKYILTTLFVCLLILPVLGQKNITLTGILVENNAENAPVEQAAIRILSLPDSTMVIGTTTTETGRFTLRGLSKGKFVIWASYVGYHDLYHNISISGDSATVDVGKLLIKQDAILLEEAIVTAKANEVVVKDDTIEYNADSYKTEQNAVVEDLLKKLPGVEVDKDGKITIGGKEVKKILVDGKEFVSDDPKVASKNLPVSLIEKLQVLDQKSDMARMTGFDDGDEQTVINLTTKPGMKKGAAVGNLAAGIGHDTKLDGDTRYEVAGMLNYLHENDRYSLIINGNNTNNMGANDLGGSRFGSMRGVRRGAGSGITTSDMITLNMNKEFSPKLTLNGNISYDASDRDVLRRTNRNTTSIARNGTPLSTINKTASGINDISDNFAINFRMEWKPDSSNTIIFRPSYSYNTSKSRENQNSLSMDGFTNDTVSYGLSNSFSKGDGHNVNGSLEYAHQFNKQGRVFSISLSGGYNTSYSQETYDWYTRYVLEHRDSLVNQQSENDNRVYNYRIFTSYVEPLGNNYFLQFAYRVSQSDTRSVNSTYDLDIAMRDTATLNTRQSRSTLRDALEQRFSLNFKSIREKYNYTIGLNVDPSKSSNKTVQPGYFNSLSEYIMTEYSERLPNLIGDSVISVIDKNVINLSPTVNFNYNFGHRSRLRIDYSGYTTQPSSNQLRDYTDYSNPRNVVTGNPYLKPGYSNYLNASFNKFVPTTQLMYSFRVRGTVSFNDVGSVTTTDPLTRIDSTTYANINGNWNVSTGGMFNVPLRNKKFSVSSSVDFAYRNNRSYTDGLLNTMTTMTLGGRAGGNYRSGLFDLELTASIRYENSVNEIQPDKNQQTYNPGIGGNTTWYLPAKFTINSDVNWSARRGYAEGYNRDEVIWNASVTKQILSGRLGTALLRLKIYDILQDRKNISRSVGSNYIQDSESNILQSFFMCSVIWQFSVFPGGSKPSNSNSNMDPSDYDPSRRGGDSRERGGDYRERGGGGGGGSRF